MRKRKVNEPADDNPVWGEEEFARARPAEAVLPELFGLEAAEQMLKQNENAAAQPITGIDRAAARAERRKAQRR